MPDVFSQELDTNQKIQIQDFLAGTRNLLSLPSFLLHVLRACNNDRISDDQIYNLVRYDPCLVAKILDIHAGSLDTSDIAQIIQRTDRETIKHLVLTSFSEKHYIYRDENHAFIHFLKDQWVHGIQAAFLARSFALQVGYQKPSQAFYTALLHNIGQLLFQSADNDEYLSLCQKASTDVELLSQESNLYGIDHTALGSRMAQNWGLDLSVQDALRYHHVDLEKVIDAHPLTRLVYLSHALCYRKFESFKEAGLFARRLFTIKTDHIAPIIESALAQATDVIRSLGIIIPKQVVRQKLVPLIEEEQVHPNLQEAVKINQLIREIELTGLMDSFKNTLNNSETELEIQGHAGVAAKTIFGAQQLFFFKTTEHSQELEGHCLATQHSCLNDIKIPLSHTSSLLARSLTSLELTHSFQQELAIVDQEIVHQTGTKGIVCLPLSINHVNEGVLVFGFNDEASFRLASTRNFLLHFSDCVSKRLHRIKQLSNTIEEIQTTEKGLYFNKLKRMVHEINNPLSIAQNHIHILSLKLSDNNDLCESFLTIQEEITRAADILKHHIDQALLEESSKEVAVNINELVSDLLLVFKTGFLDKRQIETELELDQTIPPVYIDVNTLKQILTNLIKNAAESLGESGWITIRTADQIIIDGEPFVEIQVVDDGNGIPKSLLEKLFTPVDSEKGASNSGLGLSIVKELAKNLGGSVSYRRSIEGLTIFGVYIPRHCEPPD